MNKLSTIFLIVALVFGTSLMAQPKQGGERGERGPRKMPRVEEVLTDLTQAQKNSLETIRKESHQRIEGLRKQQESVRDSIHSFISRDGDYTEVLYPLFDRDARLQSAISREMYRTKLQIGKVLTKEQREAFRKKVAEQRKDGKVERRRHRDHCDSLPHLKRGKKK